jgi:hypothetical protein
MMPSDVMRGADASHGEEFHRHPERMECNRGAVETMRTLTWGSLIVGMLAFHAGALAARQYPDKVVSLTLEAESGQLVAPMTVGSDSDASSVRYVWVPTGTGHNRNPDATDGTASYLFTIPRAGEYAIWARVRTDEGSLFVKVDDQPAFKWDPMIAGRGWTWIKTFHTEAVHPVYFHLRRGRHVLKLTGREEAMCLDRLVITNDLFSTPGEERFAPPRKVVKIWAEAEDLPLTAPMVHVSDAGASGGRAIGTPAGTARNGDPRAGGSAVYAFNIPEPGYYLIWGRVLTAPPDSDSFFVRVDDGPEIFWSLHGAKTEWKWLHVDSLQGSVFPMIYQFAAGRHQIAIHHREVGARLDRLLITNDLYFIPE